jgi:16S rRNA (guanine966-N2)-methyltransferase
MRVISGLYKRRRLATTQGNEITRPTSDRVKENLFNTISSKIQGAVVADLFAGSGALGIECLSRGAQKVFFVENHHDSLKKIKENLKNIGISSDCYFVINKGVSRFLATYESQVKVNLIFADPPYHSQWYQGAFQEIESSKICDLDCLVVFEMDAKRNSLCAAQSLNKSLWVKEDERIYGKTKIEIWRKRVSLCAQ